MEIEIENWAEKRFAIEEKDWASRIPAAIAQAEERVAQKPLYRGEHQEPYSFEKHESITATEVALAKALWEELQFEQHKLYGGIEQEPPPALHAFTEKVESLD